MTVQTLALPTLLRVARAFGLAMAGGSVFAYAGMPAAWLSGSTCAIAIATLAGLKTSVPARLRDVVFVFLGISMGSGVTPDTVARLPDWPLSLAVLAVTVVAIIGFAQLYFRRVAGWDPMTAIFASVPGALSYVMALAIETDADIRKVALAQCLRLIVLVMVLPIVLVHSGIGGGAVAAPADIALRDLVILLLTGGGGGALLFWLKVPGGSLNGAFFASALLHGAGLVHANLPFWMLVPCFALVGMVMGSRFEGTDLRLLRETFLTSLGGLMVASLMSAIGATTVFLLAHVPLGQAVLAFAPGAIEAMTGLALLLNLDPAYVAGHQLFRFFGMALTMPVFLSWYERGHRTIK